MWIIIDEMFMENIIVSFVQMCFKDTKILFFSDKFDLQKHWHEHNEKYFNLKVVQII